MIPRLPEELTDCDLLDVELVELWNELVKELLDAEYVGRRHENRRTYDAGCHGPMCRKAVREHGRRRASTKPNERYKTIDAVLDFYYPVAIARIDEMRQYILQELTAS